MRIWLHLILSVVLFSIVATSAWSESFYKAFFTRENQKVTDVIELEVAADDKSRAIGLMYRRELASNSGMLFIFPDEAPRAFWMKNTYIPLDMIFLDRHRKIQGVLENVAPLSTESKSIADIKSTYVLELPAGAYRRLALKVGDILMIKGELPKPM